MRLVFTKDVGNNFKAGVVKDYPLSVWKQIAKSVKTDLNRFTKPVDDFTNEFKGKSK